MANAFEVAEGRLVTQTGVLFEELALTIPENRTTVLLGPSGTGKSALLAQLGGEPLPRGWLRSGSWRFRGEERIAPGAVRIIHQASRPATTSASEQRARQLITELGCGPTTLLLDEPTRGVSPAAVARLSELLLEQRGQRTMIIVTHDLGLARRVADEVRLFCAGRLEVTSPASDFFDGPPTPLSRRFLQLGNCWPQAQRPPAPSHFRWLIQDQLAGMGRPGLLGDLDADLEAIAQNGIEVLVSLTESPTAPSALKSFGIEGRHLPIRDMGVPAKSQLIRVLSGIRRSIAGGSPVAVHCDAGLGRTGTVLAAFLIWEGASVAGAIEEVRRANPGYIQSRTQLRFLAMFGDDSS